ncbi:hypothetical protein [Taibaiella soli]|uniref:Outer membrane protein beta-barrel domain-containing protein n=1 Tax=Taibaiella soli TaxID=1649169 RepID=A0A2W2AB40_9BACT|nr:hypothetical protein [Taibaiella soli]PZF72511.1 hypothetical protein DN068_11645 [Taibaiella soli]
MQRFAFLITCLLFLSINSQAQDDLFGTKGEAPKGVRHQGFVFGVNASYDRPGGDMINRFGGSFRLGASANYKTKSNWIFGVKYDFLFGDNVKEDSLMYNIRDDQGAFIDQDGHRMNVGIYERGYMIGLQGGYIFTFGKSKGGENGLLVMPGVGFIQHKIKIFDKANNISTIKGDYIKGYDRLTNGIYYEQYIGYNHFAANQLLNYTIGIDFVAAFDQGRRTYLYDVRRSGEDKRTDILFGIRGGWYIPIFHRKSEDYYFQ